MFAKGDSSRKGDISELTNNTLFLELSIFLGRVNIRITKLTKKNRIFKRIISLTPLFAGNLALAILKIFHYRRTLTTHLANKDGSIGFVPTMGALHSGHIELVKASIKKCDTTVVSIFVNPKQFNNPVDLLKYPKTREEDLKKLFAAGADIVFLPQVEEVYSSENIPETHITPLNLVFEGEKRPGHFKGVTDVLHLLFEIVQPNHVFFGLKDLQQCLVVERLIAQHFPDIWQHNEATARESSGLAMSSRNTRLSRHGKNTASCIYKELVKLNNPDADFTVVASLSIANLLALGIQTEYLNLVDLPNLVKNDSINIKFKQAIVYAGFLEGVRLIDNLLI